MTTNVLEYKGYQGSIEVSIEDKVLHGKILHIVDLVTFEAQTPEGLEQAFQEEVDEYLAFCKEEGVEPDKPFKGSFNVRVGPGTHKRLVMAATRANVTLNDTVRRVLTTWLDECPEGFAVSHHHTHEYRVVNADSENTYSGAISLTARQTQRQPRMIMQ